MFDNSKKQKTNNSIGNTMQFKKHSENKTSTFSFGTSKKAIEKKATTYSNKAINTIASQSTNTKNIGFQNNQDSCISRTDNGLLGNERKYDKNIPKNQIQEKEKITSSATSNKQQNISLPENVSNKQVKQNKSLYFEFSGNKSNDLINCVLTAIHTWKKHYDLSIPDNVLMDQILTLFNQLRELNR